MVIIAFAPDNDFYHNVVMYVFRSLVLIFHCKRSDILLFISSRQENKCCLYKFLNNC